MHERSRISALLIAVAIVYLVCASAFAQQFTACGTAICASPTSASVGIGTTAPDQKLTVLGGHIAIGNTYQLIGRSASNSFYYRLIGNDASDHIVFGDTTSSVPNQMDFHTNGSATPTIVFNQSGNIGIGTTNPQHRLTVVGGHIAIGNTFQLIGGNATNSFYYRLIGNDASDHIVFGDSTSSAANEMHFHTNGSAPPTIVFNQSGNIGIGTTNPQHRLTVVGGHIAIGNTFQLIGGNATNSFYYRLIGNDASDHIVFGDTTSSVPNQMDFHTNGSATPTVVFATSGNVGIGTIAPVLRTEVHAAATVNGGAREVLGLYDTTAMAAGVGAGIAFGGKWTAAGAMAQEFASIQGIKENGIDANYASALVFNTRVSGANPAERLRIDSSGNVGIGTTSPQARLDVSGGLHVSGDATVDGNIAAKYQDVAEWVPASERMRPGTVVVIDGAAINGVKPSARSYDTGVAGVVSAQPGVILGIEGTSKVKVATTGRVKVRVDARRAPVRTGDLLVTSDEPGVAMRSQPIDVGGVKIHRPGTIIGKALEPLPGGEGEILVLLSLQ